MVPSHLLKVFSVLEETSGDTDTCLGWWRWLKRLSFWVRQQRYANVRQARTNQRKHSLWGWKFEKRSTVEPTFKKYHLQRLKTLLLCERGLKPLSPQDEWVNAMISTRCTRLKSSFGDFHAAIRPEGVPSPDDGAYRVWCHGVPDHWKPGHQNLNGSFFLFTLASKAERMQEFSDRTVKIIIVSNSQWTSCLRK